MRYVARTGAMRSESRNEMGSPKLKEHLGDRGVEERVILK